MGKTTATKTATTAPVAAAAPTNVAVETAPATPARRGKKDKMSAQEAAPTTPVPETVSVAAVPETEAAAPAEATSTATKIQEFGAKLQQMSSLFSSMKADYKALERTFARELKVAQKSSRKKRVASGNRAPSGFVKPTLISPQLAAFLGKSAGVEMARTEVSREINAYIREKGLQDKDNGRKIHPDANLTKLLALGEADELTYFNIQRFMKHHFIKADATAAAATA